MKRIVAITLIGVAIMALAIGVTWQDSTAAPSRPQFSLAWSEYPSWSVFGVAHMEGIIDGRPGKYGTVEEKYGVDIVLKEAEYDPCLQMYGSGQCDGVCITNMDVLNPSLGRKSVAIMPTSTSDGADALIVSNDIKNVAQLKGKPVYGLSLSVSEYMFVRNLEIQGFKEKDFNFTNMDPGAAALAMQQRQNGYNAIVVWNPFVLETLNRRPDTHVLFDSTTIPREIIDMVVVAQESLDKPGGENFAKAVAEAYYLINKMIKDPKTHDETLIAIGEKFSHLGLKDMETVVQQTKFYSTPQKGLALFTGSELPQTMNQKVIPFCVSHKIVPKTPTIAFGASGNVNLRFDPSYMQAVANQ